MKDRLGNIYKFKVTACPRADIKEFIETHHYSHNINGVLSSYCYKVTLEDSDVIIGAAIFGRPAMAGQWKKYTNDESSLLELRRYVAIDDTPRNFESFTLAKMIKDLKSRGIRYILSYSDPEYGHTGVIYKALGFKYMGQMGSQRVIKYQDKVYHDKAIRTTYKGRLKPFAVKLREALACGLANYITVAGKYRYIKEL